MAHNRMDTLGVELTAEDYAKAKRYVKRSKLSTEDVSEVLQALGLIPYIS
jgi:hypothetical protein